MRPIEGPQPFDVTLVMPDIALSTSAVYAALDETTMTVRTPPDLGALVESMAGADLATLDSNFFNDLQSAAITLQPQLGEWIDQHGLHLSGSGSTLFAYGDQGADLGQACSSALICSARSTSGKHCR